MLINEHTAIITSKVQLVPYCQHHVPTYHDWMKDPDIQAATASEPLSMNEEYSMQQSWRTDNDKLTFISCFPGPREQDELDRMIGDINLFISVAEEENGYLALVGELELMIALRLNQQRGLGRITLLVFLQYVLKHQSEILAEFFSKEQPIPERREFNYLRVKINESNQRSIRLFEALGFEKTKIFANWFGEYELRHKDMTLEFIKKELDGKNVAGYAEVRYDAPVDYKGPTSLETKSTSTPTNTMPTAPSLTVLANSPESVGN